MSVIRRPTPFVMVASGHGTLIVNQNDYHAVSGGRYGVGAEILSSSYYSPEEIDIQLKLLLLRREFFGDGVVAVDCGANIGVITVEWAKHMYGWGKVIAFEAQERIFYALAGNISINNCLNASARHAAVGAHSGELKIPEPDYCRPCSFGSLQLRENDHNGFIGQPIDYSEANLVTIPMITIDSLNLSRLDLIKIDVEGMELEVLEGARETIQKFKPQIVIETIKVGVAKITEILFALGYVAYEMGIDIVAVHSSDPSLGRLPGQAGGGS
jgi:FkbM family methyltransferase